MHASGKLACVADQGAKHITHPATWARERPPWCCPPGRRSSRGSLQTTGNRAAAMRLRAAPA
eukprot:scaffold442_cov268-Pinguiococcus_pyrenoidosus.AAC.38